MGDFRISDKEIHFIYKSAQKRKAPKSFSTFSLSVLVIAVQDIIDLI